MPKCYQLIGVPGAGKSTWITNQPWAANCKIVSTDNHVEAYAKSQNKTYSEVFDEYMPTAVKLMAQDVTAARNQGIDIIWDQTSTSRASRNRKFNMLREYDHVAVVFSTPPIDELKRRLDNRPGKNIPWSVMNSMINNFEMPCEDEGFSEVIQVS